MRLSLGLTILLLGTLLAGEAAAQAGQFGLSLDKKAKGLNAGDFLVLPSFGVGVGYDSNVFYEADDEWESPNSAVKMRLTPAVTISNRNPKDFSVALNGAATFNKYFSDSESVASHDGLTGEAGLRLGLFERSPVRLKLEESFRRVMERRNVESSRDFNRYVNRIGGDLVFKPGGGALGITLGYRFVSDFFSDVDKDWGDLIYHDIKLNSTWKFFPFTAAVLEANWQIRDYVADGGGFYGELTDSQPLRIKAGVTGFFTKKIALTALAGWGWSFHDSRPKETNPLTKGAEEGFSGFIAEVRLTGKWTENSLSELSYEQTFDDSLLSNYVVRYKAGIGHQQRLFRDILLKLQASYTYLDFATLPAAFYYGSDGSGGPYSEASFTRADALIAFGGSFEYEITRVLAVSAVYNLELYNYDFGNRSSVFYVGFPDGRRDYQQFTRHTVLGTISVRY